jgi:hypothetical protein
MGNLQALTVTGENHSVITHYVTASHRMKSDALAIPGAGSSLTAMHCQRRRILSQC